MAYGLLSREGKWGYPRQRKMGGRTIYLIREAVAGTGVAVEGAELRESLGRLLLLGSLPALPQLFLKGIWGPAPVSGSWPRTTAVAPTIPRDCCLPGWRI